MSTLDSCLRSNEEEVAAKVIDGEAIIINLSNGIYYSMDKVGGFIWEMIEGRHSLQTIVESISTRYDVSTEQARADVERLVAELVQENLVKAADGEAPRSDGPSWDSEQKLVYESPRLNICWLWILLHLG
jgi:hypothetical protein